MIKEKYAWYIDKVIIIDMRDIKYFKYLPSPDFFLHFNLPSSRSVRYEHQIHLGVCTEIKIQKVMLLLEGVKDSRN